MQGMSKIKSLSSHDECQQLLSLKLSNKEFIVPINYYPVILVVLFNVLNVGKPEYSWA